jgi:prepilin-type N-terminal cleavage/methylation domain-containing protein
VKIVRGESGFSLIELMVATTLLLIVSSIVTGALLQTSNAQKTISNRTAMHSGVRGATELLQQEVGQAGRIALPDPAPTLPGGATKSVLCDGTNPSLNATTVNVSAAAGMFPDMVLTTLDGDNSETVKVTAVNTGTPSITACFSKDHAAGTPLTVLGAFATGVIPPSGIVNGSSATVLKMYGDINDDGNMVYVEYTCDAAGSGNLYRNVMAFDAATKPALTNSNILLSNIIPNPGGVDCFLYQTSEIWVGATPFNFVLDVAVTLTVETEQLDPITNTYQTETKALLNVSPRNVFHAWTYAGMGYTNRIQSTPTSLAALLAPL